MPETDKFACACCGFLTLEEPGDNTYEICPVCGWENDRLQQEDPELDAGANPVTLNEARENFRSFGAISAEVRGQTRPPRDDERP